jgi:PST family polysaccharide transporter
MFIGLNWGIIGVAFSFTIFNLFSFWIGMYIIGYLINMNLKEVILFIKKPFFYTLFMMIIVYLTKTYLVTPNIEQTPVKLSINIITGIAAYAAIFLVVDGKEYFLQIKKLKNTVK